MYLINGDGEFSKLMMTLILVFYKFSIGLGKMCCYSYRGMIFSPSE